MTGGRLPGPDLTAVVRVGQTGTASRTWAGMGRPVAGAVSWASITVVASPRLGPGQHQEVPGRQQRRWSGSGR